LFGWLVGSLVGGLVSWLFGWLIVTYMVSCAMSCCPMTYIVLSRQLWQFLQLCGCTCHILLSAHKHGGSQTVKLMSALRIWCGKTNV